MAENECSEGNFPEFSASVQTDDDTVMMELSAIITDNILTYRML